MFFFYFGKSTCKLVQQTSLCIVLVVNDNQMTANMDFCTLIVQILLCSWNLTTMHLHHVNGPQSVIYGLRNVCPGFSWTCCFSSMFWSISSEFQGLQFWFDFILFSQPMSLKKLLMTLYLEIASKVQVLLFCFVLFFFLKFKLCILKQHSLWLRSWCLSNVASLRLHKNL